MTIWILALILIASGVGLGLRQGAIRTSFSFVGIVLGGLLAVPIGKLFKPLLPHVGVHSETLISAIAPFEAFILVWILFKVGGYVVHRKAEVYYKYKAGDLRLALWERLNQRLGLCVGVMNGTAWLVLVSFIIFNFTYWTAQIASSDNETKTTQLINRLGRDLDSTGLDKAAHAVAPLPDDYYKMADLAGLLCQNPALGDRLINYPPFLSLVERSDFQQLAQDSSFTDGWKSGAPVGQLLNDPQVKSILKNNDLINTVLGIVKDNQDDLITYLKTGKSPKYDSEKILGRWDFNVGVSLAMLLQTRPNIPSKEMKAVRAVWGPAFQNTILIAGSDGQMFLKNLPNFKNQPPSPETWTGSWTVSGTNYDLSISGNGQSQSLTAQTDGLRLTIKGGKNVMVFDHEN
ncbi:MAG TPA: CvpA family protein [Verrucomicrobiae bacterium]|nr:CvpA family protein [Verrucomicrobiae bacterium]